MKAFKSQQQRVSTNVGAKIGELGSPEERTLVCLASVPILHAPRAGFKDRFG